MAPRQYRPPLLFRPATTRYVVKLPTTASRTTVPLLVALVRAFTRRRERTLPPSRQLDTRSGRVEQGSGFAGREDATW